MPKNYYQCVEVEEQARFIGIELWGVSSDGNSLRVAPTGSRQPTGIMTREAITNEFNRNFSVVPASPHSCYLRVTRKEVAPRETQNNS